ncbi:mitochondrial carrier [Punctularia strigosozonata HHB-11173 SS5]|uniref:mitochondrial carrier n=1 Tax=Punctularia strigosozonata (strain HHB-11173) TaxID=741275 RepID=UPI0004416C3B|nr:mitochondrial carrier [Punctularia strigosozonata HHB-11173 SS5]EIN06487.1 mitochondrial carrier [Punctularia strigosozonata HHB-11173 SS5]
MVPAVHDKGKARAGHGQDKNWNYIIRSGLAGGIAGCVAKTVIAPLDRVKILFQTSNPDFQRYAGTWSGVFRAGKVIYNEQGVRGLLQGHSATLARVFPYAAIKFMAYDQVHHVLMPAREKETNARRFAAGAISGCISVFFTYPLELIRVRMAFQTRHQRIPPTSAAAGEPLASLASSSGTRIRTQPLRPSIMSAVAQIYHEGDPAPTAKPTTKHLFARFPVLKFYRGFTVTIVGMIPYAGTSFLSWGYMRSHLLYPREGKERTRFYPLYDLGIGAVAGAISQTASYPFEVVRRRMQVGGLTRPDRWMRWGETVKAVWAQGGWRGFYVGLSIGYMKVVPMTAVSYAVWEWGKRILGA